MNPRTPDYRLEIGALALDGFEADPAAIAATLLKELARQLADPRGSFAAPPTESSVFAIRQVQAPSLLPDASPAEIGRAAARAIISSLSKGVPGDAGSSGRPAGSAR